MKGSTNILLYACRFAHCFSEVTSESGISIGYDSLWDAKPGEEMLEIEVRYALTIYDLVTGQELCGFRASLIHYG